MLETLERPLKAQHTNEFGNNSNYEEKIWHEVSKAGVAENFHCSNLISSVWLWAFEPLKYSLARDNFYLISWRFEFDSVNFDINTQIMWLHAYALILFNWEFDLFGKTSKLHVPTHTLFLSHIIQFEKKNFNRIEDKMRSMMILFIRNNTKIRIYT